jgi:hypothetical protein
MPPATSHTEASLAAYMLAELSDVATVLGWTTQTPLQHALDKTARAYGVADIADATDMDKLEALAAVEAWAAAARALASRIDMEADGGRFDRAKLHEHALKQLAQARRDARSYLPSTLPGSAYVANVVRW